MSCNSLPFLFVMYFQLWMFLKTYGIYEFVISYYPILDTFFRYNTATDFANIFVIGSYDRSKITKIFFFLWHKILHEIFLIKLQLVCSITA